MPGAEGAAEVQRSLVWVNREGREEPLSAPPRPYAMARLSPDGARESRSKSAIKTMTSGHGIVHETLKLDHHVSG